MRRVPCVSLAFSLVALVVSGTAAAQPKKDAPPPSKKDASREVPRDTRGNALGRLFMLHDLEATRQAQIGRERMKQGDCKGALDAFDGAMKGSNDPSIRRDRGLCHENMGHPFPAMDDYRAYLTAMPDAPDSPNIRERLERLQGAATPPEATRPDETRLPTAKSGEGTGKASFNVKVGADASASASSGASGADEPGPTRDMSGHDAALALESKESAEARSYESGSSALRRGAGPVLGVVVGPRYFIPDKGDANLGYMVAGSLRYSTGPVLSAVVDVGYTGVNVGRDGTANVGGLLLMGGVEARVGLDPHVTNALIFGAGLGYERMKVASVGQVISSFVPRARAGIRHVFGPTLGLEATIDAGYAFSTVVDSGVSNNMMLAGVNLGLVTAF